MRPLVAEQIGVILAGGASRRFGSSKGLASIGGTTIIERVLRAHRAVLPASVLVTHEPALYGDLGVPTTPDRLPGLGPLAGLEAGLRWAVGAGAAGVVCTPCDAPFLLPELIRRLISRSPGHVAVLPHSRGPLGYEPLFGWYSITLLEDVEHRLGSGVRALHEFVSPLAGVAYLPLAEVREIADPDLLFLNVNTTDELEQARRRLTAFDAADR